MVECLLTLHEALGSIPTTAQTGKKVKFQIPLSPLCLYIPFIVCLLQRKPHCLIIILFSQTRLCGRKNDGIESFHVGVGFPSTLSKVCHKIVDKSCGTSE